MNGFSALQAGGRRFDPGHVHQPFQQLERVFGLFSDITVGKNCNHCCSSEVLSLLLTCPQSPRTSDYEIRIANGNIDRANAAVGVGKWETRSVFQGGEAAVFSTSRIPRELLGRPITQAAVRPLLIVLSPPSRDFPARLKQIPEPAHA